MFILSVRTSNATVAHVDFSKDLSSRESIHKQIIVASSLIYLKMRLQLLCLFPDINIKILLPCVRLRQCPFKL